MLLPLHELFLGAEEACYRLADHPTATCCLDAQRERSACRVWLRTLIYCGRTTKRLDFWPMGMACDGVSLLVGFFARFLPRAEKYLYGIVPWHL